MGRKQKTFDDRALSPVFAVPTRQIIPIHVFRSTYPLSHGLGLKLVSVAGYDHSGFDSDDVKKKLGADRYASLEGGLKEVFCCGHRTWPADHPDVLRRNCEVHCIYARDVEAFLKAQRTAGGRNQRGGL